MITKKLKKFQKTLDKNDLGAYTVIVVCKRRNKNLIKFTRI